MVRSRCWFVALRFTAARLSRFKGDEHDAWQSCIDVRLVAECKVMKSPLDDSSCPFVRCSSHASSMQIGSDSKYFSFVSKEKTYDLWSDKSDVSQIW